MNLNKTSRYTAAAALFSGVAAMFRPQGGARRERKPFPTMIVSPGIAAWNRAVTAKKLPRIKRPTRVYETGQHPKLAPQRVHKQHKHQLRDEHGAITLVGGTYTVEGEGLQPTSREHLLGGVFEGVGAGGRTEYTARRIWLGGISAQRGY